MATSVLIIMLIWTYLPHTTICFLCVNQGATIQRKEETGEIIVARVMTDGAAYRTGG